MNPKDVSALFIPEGERGTVVGAGSASSAKLMRKGSRSGASEQEQALCHNNSGYASGADPFLQHLSDGYVSDPEISSFQEISSLRQHSNGSSSTIDELVGVVDEAPASINKKQVHRRYFSLHRAGFGSLTDDVVIEESCSPPCPYTEETNVEVSKNVIKGTEHDAAPSKPERRSSLTTMHRRFWSIKKEEMSSKIKAADEVDDASQLTKTVEPCASNPEIYAKKKNIRSERAKLHRRWQSLHRDRLIETAKASSELSNGSAKSSDAVLATPEINHSLNTNKQSEGSKIEAKHSHSLSILVDASTLPPLDERHVLTTTELHMDSPILAASNMIPELIAEKSPTSVLPTLGVDADINERTPSRKAEGIVGVADVSSTNTPGQKGSTVQHKLHPQHRHRRWQSLYREGLLGNENSDTK